MNIGKYIINRRIFHIVHNTTRPEVTSHTITELDTLMDVSIIETVSEKCVIADEFSAEKTPSSFPQAANFPPLGAKLYRWFVVSAKSDLLKSRADNVCVWVCVHNFRNALLFEFTFFAYEVYCYTMCVVIVSILCAFIFHEFL